MAMTTPSLTLQFVNGISTLPGPFPLPALLVDAGVPSLLWESTYKAVEAHHALFQRSMRSAFCCVCVTFSVGLTLLVISIRSEWHPSLVAFLFTFLNLLNFYHYCRHNTYLLEIWSKWVDKHLNLYIPYNVRLGIVTEKELVNDNRCNPAAYWQALRFRTFTPVIAGALSYTHDQLPFSMTKFGVAGTLLLASAVGMEESNGCLRSGGVASM